LKRRKKLLFVTGSRGEWGYIRPVLRLCQQSDDFVFKLCVTNMHLLPAYGMPVKEIEADGFEIDYRVPMAIDGGDHVAMAKSLGVFLCSFTDIMASARPDWIVLAGDRGEQMMAALAGGFCYVPVAHIQAGEVSGNIDGMTRHAIGKYAHLHLAANQDAADRLLKLGEEAFRVHNVGAPQLDELVAGTETPLPELSNRLSIDLQRPFILVVLHATTEEAHLASTQVATTFEALAEFDLPKIVILPNNDAGSFQIRRGIENLRTGDFHCFANLRREDYLALLRHSRVLVGNSSSGLLEAPTYRVPAVNLGRRQDGRLRGPNVLDVPFERGAIATAIRRAVSEKMRVSLQRACANPYGDGHSAARIVALLRDTAIDNVLLTKKLTY